MAGLLVSFAQQMKNMKAELSPDDDLLNDHKPIEELYPDLLN